MGLYIIREKQSFYNYKPLVRRNVIITMNTLMNEFFNQLPNWSKTTDPTYQPDYTGLKSVALKFIESSPVTQAHFVLSEQSLTELAEQGVPTNKLAKLGTMTYNHDEFLDALVETIGKEQFDKYNRLILKYTEIWRTEIKAYSHQHCFPNLDLAKASALYLFFRVVFELPSNHPRDETKVFGGWLHPSIPSVEEPETPSFNLAWPVEAHTNTNKILKVHPLTGYFGKGYDAIGEYDYFLDNFSLRQKKILEKMTFEKYISNSS